MSFSLRTLQDQCVAALQADPFFSTNINTGAPIPVLTYSAADILFKLAQELDKTCSLVVILTPDATVISPNLPGPYFDSVRLTAEILENPVLNNPATTGNPAADDIAMAVCRILHQSQPSINTETIYVKGIKDTSRGDYSMRHVEMGTQAGINSPMPRLAQVGVAIAGNTVTITPNSTPGAAVFYTLDGSYPSPRNPSSQLYLTPFTVSGPATINAVSWLAGYLPSNPTQTLKLS